MSTFVLRPSCVTVQLTIADHEAVVTPAGEFDLATVHRLNDALDAASQCSSSIRLDFGGVTFIDSRTVDVLVEHARACARTGGQLQIHNSAGEPRKVLLLSGLRYLVAS